MRPPLRQSWSEQENEILKTMLALNVPVWRIAHRLHRSQAAVRSRLAMLNLYVPSGTQTLPQMRRAVFRPTPSRTG